jgi:hypothetical protein
MKNRSEHVTRLKCEIEDQKCANAALYAKISEERQTAPLDVKTMMRNLDELKKKARAGAASLRVVGIEDACVQHLLSHAESLYTAERIQLLNTTAKQLRERLLILREKARRNWTASDTNPKKLAAFAKLQITAMESFNQRLDIQIRQIGDERLRLRGSMLKTQKSLIAKTSDLSIDFFQTFLPQ